MKTFIFYFFLITIFLFQSGKVISSSLAEEYSPTSLSNEERDWLNQNPDKLTLFYNTEFPPIEFSSSEGNFIGLGADIIELIEKRLDVSFIKKPCLDWNEHLAALENGVCAIAPVIVRNLDREHFSFFTKPYATVPVVIIAANDAWNNLTLDDLGGKRVAVVSGFVTEKYVRDRANGRFDIIAVNNVQKGLYDVSFGQADVLVENMAVAAYFIEKEGLPNLHVAGTTDYSFAWSIGISRKYPLLFNSIQKVLAGIPPSEIEKIRKRWISLSVPKGLDPETVLLLKLATLFTALLVLFLILISLILKRRLNEKLNNLNQIQNELRESEEKYRLIVDHSTDLISTLDKDGVFLYASPSWEKLLGYDPSFLTGKPFHSLIHPDDLNDCIEYQKNLFESNQVPHSLEHRIRHSNNSWQWHICSAAPVRNSAGKIIAIVGISRDITERRITEEALANNERWFRAIFDHSPYAIVINSLEDGRYLDANKAFLESRRIRKEDLLKLCVRDFVHLSREKELAVLGELKEKGSIKNVEQSIPKHDGTMSHIIYSSVLLDIQGKKQILSMTVDITEKKLAEEALRESEQRYARAISATTDAIWEWDLPTGLTYFSPRWYEMLGYSDREFEMNIESWKRLCHPDEIETTLETVRQTLDAPDSIKFIVEFRMKAKDETWKWILGRGDVAERDENGKALVLSGTNTDITERKKLEAQLIQSQKMEAVGRLAGGVAHDFNNMLAVITGYAELAKNEADEGGTLHKRLDEILKASFRSANLTRQLLAFARQQTIEPKVIDLNETIDGMSKMLRRLIGENISLSWLPGEHLWTVKMDPTQVDQILANLCVNARDAIQDYGKISIETKNATFDESFCKTNSDSRPGEYVMISVSDNGCGMDKEIQSQIFEPFFTTKELGKGTGLGLATVYGTVRQNQGFINIDSEPGIGSSFNIYIPSFKGESDNKSDQVNHEIPRAQGETILLVEDEPMLLEMGQSILESQGYNVLSAATPLNAIRLADEHKNEIHLLLTDVIMPEINGRDLAQKLLSTYPDMKCLFMSGYTSDAIAHHGVLKDGVHFIQKPFSMQDLAAKVRELLDHSIE